MSIKSTHIITKEDCLDIIKLKLNDCTDKQLENILEEVIHNGFYNFSIVTQEEFDKNLDEEYPEPYITKDNVPEYNDAW